MAKGLEIKVTTIFILLVTLGSFSLGLVTSTAEGSSQATVQNQITAEATSEIFRNGLANAEASALPGHVDAKTTDFNGYAIEPTDTSNNASKQGSVPDTFINIDNNIVEKKAEAFESPLASFFGTLIKSDENNVTTLDNSDNSCSSTSSNQLGEYYYKTYIDSSGDVDWYRGYKAQSLFLRVIMIPPVGKDYDIEIWDDCGTLVTSCNAGGSSTEVCNAGISGDFYVKVYGYNSQYSSNAPYFIVAGYNAACTTGGANGNPIKSSYACNETLQAQNQRFTNTNSSTISYHYFESLHYPSNNFAGEGQVPNNSLASNSTANWTTGGYYPSNSGWAEAGTYTFKSAFMAFCSNGGISSANALAYPYVPNAPCVAPGTINGFDGSPSKTSYACNEDIVTQNHKFENTSNTYTFNYKLYYELKDPSGNTIYSGNKPNQSLSPGYYVNWNIPWPQPTGGWPKSGTYTVKVWVDGSFTDGRARTAYSYAYPYVPTAPCPNCNLSSSNGTPSKSSYLSYEDIVTQNHRFINNGNLKYTYDLYYKLFDSGGTEISSGSKPGQTLDAGYYVPIAITWYPPTSGWDKTGTYTSKVYTSGSCSNGVQRDLYSYAYPVVDPTCHVKSDSAWVQQDNLCSESIIAKHKFINDGTRTLPYNVNFYLYDPSNQLVGQTSNSNSVNAKYNTTWIVTWHAPSGGWKAGTYRSEAYLNGNCTGGGSASANNSASPSMPASCDSASCPGVINVNVKDNASNNIPNTKVYVDGSYRSNTDSSGNYSASTSDISCGRSHSVAIYCSDGTYCGTKSTTIDFRDDDDALGFTCQVCAQNNILAVTASANSAYSLNSQINLQITVRDGSGSLVNGANLTIYDPFLGYNVSRTATSGTYAYTTTASRTGSQTFNITASKSGYNSTTASRNVSVSQSIATIVVNVVNPEGNPVQNAKVYLGDSFLGTTDSKGKFITNTQAGNRKVSIYCPNNNYCAEKNINLNGIATASFECECVTDVLVSISVPRADCKVPGINYCPIANVQVVVDNQWIGITNPIGYLAIPNMNLGEHKVEVYMYLKDNETDVDYKLKTTSKIVTVSPQNNKINFIVQPQGISASKIPTLKTEDYNNAVYLTNAEVKPQYIQFIIAIVVAAVLVDSGWNYGNECVGLYLKYQEWKDKCSWDTVFVGLSVVGASPAATKIAGMTLENGIFMVEAIEKIPYGARFVDFFGGMWKFVSGVNDSIYAKTIGQIGWKALNVGDDIMAVANTIKNPFIAKPIGVTGQVIYELGELTVTREQILKYISKADLTTPTKVRGALGEMWIQKQGDDIAKQVGGNVITKENVIFKKQIVSVDNEEYLVSFRDNGRNLWAKKVSNGERYVEIEGLLEKDGVYFILQAKTGNAANIADELAGRGQQLFRGKKIVKEAFNAHVETIVGVPKNVVGDSALDSLKKQNVRFIAMTEDQATLNEMSDKIVRQILQGGG